MTTRPGHLQLVTARPEAPAPARPAAPAVPAVRSAGVPRIVAGTAAAAAVLVLLGTQPWPLPQRTGGGGCDVPEALLTFLLLCAGGCLWAAGRLTRPDRTLRSLGAARVWWAVVVAAALVSVTADLSLASYAGTADGPGDLLVRWLVPAVPAVLGGVLARQDGRAARIRAALGTGVVTLPLFALGWVLLASPAGTPAGLPDALGMTLLAGVSPFALAVAFVAAERP